MCLSMEQILSVIKFFKRYSSKIENKGIRNLLEKIEYYH